MNTVNVKHPNPTLNLPIRKLYEYKQTANGFSSSIYSKQNIAFSTPVDMFKCAIKRTTGKPGLFVVVAWAFVNGNPIEPIGCLCFDQGSYLFTPLNPSNEDFKSYKAGKTVNDIVHQINDDYRENPLMLEAKRGWFFVDKGKGEKLDAALFDRVSRVFAHALFKECVTMEQLYEIAV